MDIGSWQSDEVIARTKSVAISFEIPRKVYPAPSKTRLLRLHLAMTEEGAGLGMTLRVICLNPQKSVCIRQEEGE